jgi:LysM repeat protein
VGELKQWNHLRDNHAPRGARLKIYPGGVVPARTSDSKPERAGAAKLRAVSAENAPRNGAVQHRVKPGETLSSIAHNYHTSINKLRQMNPFLANRMVEVGDLLVIHPAR